MVIKIAKAGKIMMTEAMSNGETPSQDNEDAPGSTEKRKTDTTNSDRPSEKDTGNYSGRIDCPTITDGEGNPKNILKIVCKTCDHREGCPAL